MVITLCGLKLKVALYGNRWLFKTKHHTMKMYETMEV
jgi:hypothetical protein